MYNYLLFYSCSGGISSRMLKIGLRRPRLIPDCFFTKKNANCFILRYTVFS